ncbi:phosphate acetyltransferase [Simkania sp.]|uniref:phosphate acetyltransferase n=1 Tax=Simkania sp. TaxID=34094 RepID=UPI003B520CFC
MTHTLLMAPIGLGVGLATVSSGLVRALENQGLKVSFLDPVTHDRRAGEKVCKETALSQVDKPLPIQCVESLLSQGEEAQVLEFLVAHYAHHAKDADIVVIQGIISTQLRGYAPQLNFDIAQALDAEVIFVIAQGKNTPETLSEQIEIAAQPYGGVGHAKTLGCMINKVGAPVDKYGNARIDLFDPIESAQDASEAMTKCAVFKKKNFRLLGCFPWERRLMALRVKDIQKHLGAMVISEGKMNENRVMHLAFAAATVENMAKILKPETMVVTSGDRSDAIVAACLSYLNGTNLAALVLSGGYLPGENTQKLCQEARKMGLPILSVQTDSLRTAISLENLNIEVPEDDVERQEMIKEFVARNIDKKWIEELGATHPQRYLSPPAFRYMLIEKAQKAHRKIVLPEGEESRILRAAGICARRKIAKIVLLGNREKVERLAEEHNVPLGEWVEVIDPCSVREKYVPALVELRKHKGVTEKDAYEYLSDEVMLGTMMLATGDVDGLVAGATHTTAHTILPALKVIKTKPDTKLVSSVFFMCLPSQVLVYGDCAVNQNPTAQELADIAVQSADSAERFGIPARVAMISYSTGKSGTGADVEKVEEATRLAREKRPDLLIDGPLQYDAAFTPDVAKKKAPDSPVAGKATVYVFPDLNTANTTYKAVQRSANVLSIGPMLQGLKKPVNDLSRGATVADIVFTIAITAIQAEV